MIVLVGPAFICTAGAAICVEFGIRSFFPFNFFLFAALEGSMFDRYAAADQN
jgi:hypothetical protein